jgi:thioredoxin 1
MPFQPVYDTHNPSREDVDRMAGPVLLEFGTDWCGFCQRVQSDLQAALQSHPHIQHVKVEDGPGRPLGRSFRVKLWPTLVFLQDGVVQYQVSRPRPEDMAQGFAALAK